MYEIVKFFSNIRSSLVKDADSCNFMLEEKFHEIYCKRDEDWVQWKNQTYFIFIDSGFNISHFHPVSPSFRVCSASFATAKSSFIVNLSLFLLVGYIMIRKVLQQRSQATSTNQWGKISGALQVQIEELQRQMEYIIRQSDGAAIASQQQIATLEMHFSGSLMSQIDAITTAGQAQINALKAHLATLKRRSTLATTNNEEQICELKTSLAILARQSNESNEAYTARLAEFDELKLQVLRLNEDTKKDSTAKQAQLDEIKTQMTSIKCESDVTSKANIASQAQINELGMQLVNLRNQRDQDSAAIQVQIKDLTTQLLDALSRIDETNSASIANHVLVSELQAQLTTLTRQQAEARSTDTVVQAQLFELQTQLGNFTNQSDENAYASQEQICELQMQLNVVLRQSDESRAAYTASQLQIGELEKQIANLKNQRHEDTITSHEQIEKVKMQLKTQTRPSNESVTAHTASTAQITEEHAQVTAHSRQSEEACSAYETIQAQISDLERRRAALKLEREVGASNSHSQLGELQEQLTDSMEEEYCASATLRAQIEELKEELAAIKRQRSEDVLSSKHQIGELQEQVATLIRQNDETGAAYAFSQSQVDELQKQMVAFMNQRNEKGTSQAHSWDVRTTFSSLTSHSYDSNSLHAGSFDQIGKMERQLNPRTTLNYTLIARQAWKEFFGDVSREVPGLPCDIDDILNSACPFWPDKAVRDTHVLVLIPASINGQPFTLNLLDQMIRKPRGEGHKAAFWNYHDKVRDLLGQVSIENSYWVLMTRDVLEGSRNKTISDQQSMASLYTDLGYETPTVLEAATAILVHHVRTGERLFSDNPKTFIRCQEWVDNNPVVVGNFTVSGLRITRGILGHVQNGHKLIGIACCRRLHHSQPI